MPNTSSRCTCTECILIDDSYCISLKNGLFFITKAQFLNKIDIKVFGGRKVLEIAHICAADVRACGKLLRFRPSFGTNLLRWQGNVAAVRIAKLSWKIVKNRRFLGRNREKREKRTEKVIKFRAFPRRCKRKKIKIFFFEF